MSAHFPEENANHYEPVQLSELSLDLKRVLTVQFKEFVHHIEDVEGDAAMPHNPRIISFLERCYSKAA